MNMPAVSFMVNSRKAVESIFVPLGELFLDVLFLDARGLPHQLPEGLLGIRHERIQRDEQGVGIEFLTGDPDGLQGGVGLREELLERVPRPLGEVSAQ
jgi:hypothetical protein